MSETTDNEIIDAMKVMGERKEAVIGHPPDPFDIPRKDGEEAKQDTRLLYSGLDVDVEQLVEAVEKVSQSTPLAMLGAMLNGAGPGVVAAAYWADGLGVGLLVAERRQRRREANDSDRALASRLRARVGCGTCEDCTMLTEAADRLELRDRG